MYSPTETTRRWLSRRIRLYCAGVFVIGSLLPPYVPKAALAPPETTIAQQQFLLVEEGFLMKSSSLTKSGARRAYTKGHVHVVKTGDNLESLAKRYQISVDTIRWANNFKDESSIHPGDEIIILPVDGILHNVKRGQTLLRIAYLYDINLADIMERNDLQSAFIAVGQQLIIPGGAPIVSKPTLVATAELPPTGTSLTVKTKDPQQADTPIVFEVTPPSAIVTAEDIASDDQTIGVLQKPCSSVCFITQNYHGGHFALDLQERGGGNIYASEAGTIIRADYGWNGGYGNVIEIDHGNGLVTLYGHNKHLDVQEGQTVIRGQKIADMGNSGLVYGKTGIHTHFEVRLRGVKKNPILYIQ